MERPRFPSRWAETLLFALPVFAASVALKHLMLLRDIDVRVALKQHLVEPGSFGWVPFFAADAFWTLGVLPLVLLILTVRLRPAWRWALCFLLVETLLGSIGIAWITRQLIGRFPTISLTRDFLYAYRADPALVSPGDLVPAIERLRATVVVLGGLVPLGILSVGPARRFWSGLLAKPLAVAVVLALAGGGGARLSTQRFTTFHRSLLVQLGSGFVSNTDKSVGSPISPLTPESLQRHYEEIVFPRGRPPAPAVPVGPAPHPGRRNVLLVVLETHAATDYDLTNAHTWPNLAPLVRHAIVATRHFASHPNSARDDFTMLASVYEFPSRNALAKELTRGHPARLEAVPWLLRQAGYEARYYYPSRFLFPEDEWALHYLGFDTVVEGTESAPVVRQSPSRRLEVEAAMFDTVEQYLASRGSTSPPFFAMVRTMIGHDPLIDPLAPDSTTDRSPASLSRAREFVARTEDGLIGRLLAALGATGALERTVVVLVGDHGDRFRDGVRVRTGVLGEATFPVPMLLYAPHVAATTRRLGWTTSHVDLAPTILDLLGRGTPAGFQQGMSMLDPAIAERVTFVLAEGFSGADAAIYRDRYYLRNYVMGAEFLSPEFDFTPASAEAARAGSQAPAAADLARRLQRFRELQLWLRQYLLVKGPSAPGNP